MSKWLDGYVNSNGLRIHYYRTGGDKPKVVFNHGAGDDGLCWTRVVKELENNYDVIMVDARGHGKTSSGKRFALAACGRVWTLLESKKKLEARKMLDDAVESHTSAARGIGHFMERETRQWINKQATQANKMIRAMEPFKLRKTRFTKILSKNNCN